jgi:hypothetical protein
MTAIQSKTIIALRFLHVICALGALFSLITHIVPGIVISGLLAGGCSVVINRICRKNPASNQQPSAHTSKAYVVYLWGIAGCIALVLIGVPYLTIFAPRH